MGSYSSSEKTRQALINATGELAAEMGFSNVTTRAIAKKAGENVGSIHYHFGGKASLFQAVLDEATRKMRENPFSQIVEDFDSVLDTPEGQSRAIRAMVRTKITMLFENDDPLWHCRVLYQVLRRNDAMRDWLLEKVLHPSLLAEEELFRRIRPDMTAEELTLHSFLLGTPLYFHADYMDVISSHFGEKKYSSEYLRMMEDKLVRQTQLYFSLPDDKEFMEYAEETLEKGDGER